jgi:hypothetical protein
LRPIVDTESPATPPQKSYEHSYKSVDEWLAHSKSKGFLVEQIYQRPGWGKVLGVVNAQGYHTNDTQALRKKLMHMSAHDLAEILVRLDSM